MARNLRGPACPGYGKARDAASAAGEGRLVAAALGVLVEQIGVAVVGVVAVVVGALGDFVEVVAVVVLVADGRLVGIAAVADGAAPGNSHGRGYPALCEAAARLQLPRGGGVELRPADAASERRAAGGD